MFSKLKLTCVSVAFCTAVVAVPASAAPSPASQDKADLATDANVHDDLFWSATNLHDDAKRPVLRRVVLSGYHPVAGFEAEVAAEERQYVHTRAAIAMQEQTVRQDDRVAER